MKTEMPDPPSRNYHLEIADERDRLLRENIAGSALNAQMAKQLSDLRAEVERLTRERDNAITKCYELEDQVSDQTVKAKTAERERDEAREKLLLIATPDGIDLIARAEAAERQVATLREALREIEWSNNCEWQRQRAQTALTKEPPK